MSSPQLSGSPDVNRPGCLRILAAIAVAPIVQYLVGAFIGLLYITLDATFFNRKGGLLTLWTSSGPPTLEGIFQLLALNALAGYMCGAVAIGIARGRRLLVGVLAGLPNCVLTITANIFSWDIRSPTFVATALVGFLSVILTSLYAQPNSTTTKEEQ